MKKTKHNLEPLRKIFDGNDERLVRELLKASEGVLPQDGHFKDIAISVQGYTIHTRGRIMEGVVKFGTYFIKPDNLK